MEHDTCQIVTVTVPLAAEFASRNAIRIIFHTMALTRSGRSVDNQIMPAVPPLCRRCRDRQRLPRYRLLCRQLSRQPVIQVGTLDQVIDDISQIS